MIPRRAVLAAAAALVVPGCAPRVDEPAMDEMRSRAWPTTGGSAAGGRAALDLRGDRVFVAVAINGVRTVAILDSAAELTVLDRSFAASLHLGDGTAVTARGTGTATAAATVVAGVALTVAGRTLRPANVAVIDLRDVAARIGAGRVDVILGRDLFDAGVVALDLASGALQIVGGDAAHPGVAVPLTARRGIETMPVTIEGIAAIADFDLGNGGTVLIGAAFARRHRLLSGRATGVIPGGGIGGATEQTTFTLASLDLAGHRFVDVPVAIDASPTAADANIGVRLLRRFGIVTDFPGRQVWLDWRG